MSMESARAAAPGDRRRSTSGSRAACASTRGSRRTSWPTARSISRKTSAGSSNTCIASPHSQLRKDTDQTARMLAAVKLPGVAILGHPQGRMYNTRPGITADWRKVFKEAAGARRRGRDRRQLAPAGHRLRAGGDRDGGGLHLRARQRRAQHRGVPVHRLRHRPRADRADPRGPRRQLLGGVAVRRLAGGAEGRPRSSTRGTRHGDARSVLRTRHGGGIRADTRAHEDPKVNGQSRSWSLCTS